MSPFSSLKHFSEPLTKPYLPSFGIKVLVGYEGLYYNSQKCPRLSVSRQHPEHSLLATLPFWSQWLGLCVGTNRGNFLQTSIPDSASLIPKCPTYNPIVNQSLRIWRQFRSHFGLQSSQLSYPYNRKPAFPPSLNDNVFGLWSKKGITTIKDIVHHTFTQLSSKFNLPKTQLLFQIRDFVRKTLWHDKLHSPWKDQDKSFAWFGNSLFPISPLLVLLRSPLLCHQPPIF